MPLICQLIISGLGLAKSHEHVTSGAAAVKAAGSRSELAIWAEHAAWSHVATRAHHLSRPSHAADSQRVVSSRQTWVKIVDAIRLVHHAWAHHARIESSRRPAETRLAKAWAHGANWSHADPAASTALEDAAVRTD